MPSIKVSARSTLLVFALGTVAGVLSISACSSEPNAPTGTVAVAVAPTSINVAQGGTGNAAATITRGGSFTGAVTLSQTGAPAGITVTFSPDVVAAGSTASTVNVAVGAAVAAGSYPLTLRAAGTDVTTATTTLTVVVVAGGGTLAAAVNPTSINVAQGGTGSAALSITRGGAFTGPVTLSQTGAPAGVTVTFTPATVAVGSTTSTVNLAVAGTVAAASYPITISAAGTGVTTATATLTTVVVASGAGAIALSASPTTLTAAAGAAAVTSAITITRTAPFTGAVALAVTGAPAGVTASVSPASTAGTTATLSVSSTAAAVNGTYPLTVRGSGSGVSDATTIVNATVTGGSAGSIALSASPTTLTAAAGAAAVTSTITITRTAPFTGPVALAVTGAPAGVTASVSPASAAGTTATLSVTSTAAALNGTYPLTVTASGTGVSNATTIVNATVTGGSAGSIALSASPTTLTAAAGAAAVTSAITITRTAPFTGAVALAVTGAPAGVTASVSPASTAGTTATLSVTSTAAALNGTYPLTVTGSGTGVSNATTIVNATVTGGGGGGGGNVSVTFCAENAPLWVATQSGNGAWAQVTPTGTTYQFTFTSGTGGVAVVQSDGAGGFELSVFYATFAEFTGVGGSLAANGCGTKTVNGSVAGVGPTQTSTVYLGPANANPTSATPNFVLNNVPEGSLDLIAILTNPPFVVNRIILRPGLTQANNSNIPVLDFAAAEAFAPNTANNVTVANLGTDDAIILSQYWGSNGATTAGIGSILGYTAPVAYNAIPVANLPAGALQSLSTNAFNAADPTHSRFAGVYFRTPAAKTITLGPDLSAPTSVTKVVSGANAWPRMQLPSQTEYNKLLTASYTQNSLDRIAAVSATAGYYGAAPATWDLVLPVLNGVTGWNTTWGLQNGTDIDWTALAQGGTAQIISPITDGSTFQWAGRSSGPTPLTLHGLRSGADPFGLQRRLQATLNTTGVR